MKIICSLLLYCFAASTSIPFDVVSGERILHTAAITIGTSNSLSKPYFTPYRISYEDLGNDINFDNSDEEVNEKVKITFKKALSEVGLVSVTGLFSGSDKANTLGWLHPCSIASEETQVLSFEDGTVRRTMATSCLPSRNAHPAITHFKKEGYHPNYACDPFAASSNSFRLKVTEATTLFMKRVVAVLDIDKDNTTPILASEKKESEMVFGTLVDVVRHGKHLEHFHSYTKTSSNNNDEDHTIHWHTDQGLLLAFTPGRKVNTEMNNYEDSSVTKGLYIQLNDGNQVEVEFETEDDLVFMFGDGVNQFVNKKYDTSAKNKYPLRATPHALKVPSLGNDEARVWYGRMVLAPEDAIHPMYNMTFGEVRASMIQANLKVATNSGETQTLLDSLGCSSNTMMTRMLAEEVACNASDLYCWHSCVDPLLHNVSDEICTQRNLKLGCGDENGTVWDDSHGEQWKPTCLALDAETNVSVPTATEQPIAAPIVSPTVESSPTASSVSKLSLTFLGSGGCLELPTIIFMTATLSSVAMILC